MGPSIPLFSEPPTASAAPFIYPSYTQLHHALIDRGTAIPSRYGETFELQNVQVAFTAGATIDRPLFNRRLAFMELAQIVAGVFDIEAVKRVAPKARLALFTPEGAYGPRLKGQFERAITYLRADPTGRQAVLFVGCEADSCSDALPCTVSIQLLLRNGFLDAFVTMRSWDATLGLPTDIVCFGGLVVLLAHCLNVKPGVAVVTAGSFHMYTAYDAKLRVGKLGREFRLNRALIGYTEWSYMKDIALLDVQDVHSTLTPFSLFEYVDDDWSTSGAS